jgi:adenylate cyclase
MRQSRIRLGALAALIALFCGMMVERYLSAGLSFDALLSLRHLVFGDRHAPEESRVVVVAIDEATFDDPEFKDIPLALWAPQFAKALDLIDRAGPAVIGADILFTATVEKRIAGYDKPLIEAFRRLGSAERIVLAQAPFGTKMIGPHKIFAYMVGGGKNIRSIGVIQDNDGVVRHMPLLQAGKNLNDPEAVPGFALTLAQRAGLDLNALPDGASRLSPNYADATIAPTYPMRELFACADEPAKDAELAAVFKDKVVLLGFTLDVEDRKVVAGRAFADGDAGFLHLPCAAEGPVVRADRGTIPGVFIHAQAVNDLLRGELVRFWPLWSGWTAMGVLAAIGSGLAMVLRAPAASAWLVGALALWTAGATSAAYVDWMAPLLGGTGSGVIAFLVGLGLRNLVIDREQRRTVLFLSRYLDARVARKLLDSDQPPKLGGEMREVTIWFSDIAGFSSVAERLNPEALVKRLNYHFTIIGAVIEAEGGIIDKYVGDAVVAVFGAPLSQPDHAARAVRAALRVQEQLAAEVDDPDSFKIRIGLNSGSCLVGSIGSEKRLNYTAIGDAVNVAARLEAANKEYGTTILASNATVRAAGPGFRFREIGPIQVKGRVEPVAVNEVLGLQT